MNLDTLLGGVKICKGLGERSLTRGKKGPSWIRIGIRNNFISKMLRIVVAGTRRYNFWANRPRFPFTGALLAH